MEAEGRKRGREQETTERSESDHLAKKLDVDGCCGRGGGGEEGRGVFDFPWLKREGEGGGGVMSEEEWKVTAATEEEDTFLGSLGRCCCDEEEEVEIEQGLPFLEDNNSTSPLSLSVEELEIGVSLEEAWDGDGDGMWTSLLSIRD